MVLAPGGSGGYMAGAFLCAIFCYHISSLLRLEATGASPKRFGYCYPRGACKGGGSANPYAAFALEVAPAFLLARS